MHDVDKSCEVKERLLDWIKCETEEGKENVYPNVHIFGAIVDAAKDMAEIEEKCAKAMYYKCLVCEMLQGEDGEGRYGYDNWRYASGRFAPTGHGHRTGYTNPFKGNVHVHDPNVDGMFRMGYPMDRDAMYGRSDSEYDRAHQGSRSRYGSAYDDYAVAKRHYTESRKEDDRKMMNGKIEEAVMDTVAASKEMWRDATPETRKGMKAAFMKMLEEMV